MMRLRIILFIYAILFSLTGKCVDFTDSIRQAYYLEQARNKKIAPQKRIAYYDSIIACNKTNLRLHLEQGSLYEEMGQYQKALDSYMELKGRIPKDSLRLMLKHGLHYAAIQFYLQNDEEAVKNAYSITATKKPDSLLYYDVEANRLLSHIFDYPPAQLKIYLERAEKKYDIFKETDAPAYLKEITLGNLHFSKSSAALEEKDYPTAFKEGSLSRQLLSKYEDEGISALNMALIYHDMDELDMAEKYYKELLSVDDYHPDRLVAALNYSHLLLSRGDIAEAKRLLESQHDALKILEGTPWEGKVYYTQYAVAEANGDYPAALDYLKKSYLFTDSLNQQRRKLYLQNLAEKYEGTDRDSVNMILSEKVSRLIIVIIILAMAFIGAVIAVILIYLRKKRTTDEVKSLSETLSLYEQQNLKQSQQTAESLGERSRQLSSMTMHMKCLNEELSNIESTINNSSLSKEDIVADIKKSLRVLDGQENVWEMFKVYFEEVNQRFFDNLFKVCPELTNAEVRMCAYMLTGMTTKEIASVTNRSVRTVDCIKYNIRRKLNISEPTETFMRRLSAEGTGFTTE